MKEFKILNTSISFDEELQEYSEIYVHFINLCNNFSKRYSETIIPISVETMENLVSKITKILQFMDNEFDVVINEVMDYFIKYKLFNKNKEDVKMHSISMIEYREYIDNIQNEIHKAINDMNYDMDNLMLESKQKAIDTVGTGTYLNVWSSSAFGLLLAESMNASEYKKINQKQSEVWKANYEVGYNQLQYKLSEKAKILNSEITTTIYNYGIKIINEMFECLIHLLTLEEKMLNPAIDKLEIKNAKNILGNLERITDKETKQEQLSVALENYPFLEEIHKEILNYDINIEEYVSLVKFIKYDNIIYNYCMNAIENILKDEEIIRYLEISYRLDNENCINDVFKVLLNAIIKNINSESPNKYILLNYAEKVCKSMRSIKDININKVDSKEKELLEKVLHKVQLFYQSNYERNINTLNYEIIQAFIKESEKKYELKQKEIDRQQNIQREKEIKLQEKREQKVKLQLYGIPAIIVIIIGIMIGRSEPSFLQYLFSNISGFILVGLVYFIAWIFTLVILSGLNTKENINTTEYSTDTRESNKKYNQEEETKKLEIFYTIEKIEKLCGNSKIEIIKRLREETGMDLKTAKDMVDKYYRLK